MDLQIGQYSAVLVRSYDEKVKGRWNQMPNIMKWKWKEKHACFCSYATVKLKKPLFWIEQNLFQKMRSFGLDYGIPRLLGIKKGKENGLDDC